MTNSITFTTSNARFNSNSISLSKMMNVASKNHNSIYERLVEEMGYPFEKINSDVLWGVMANAASNKINLQAILDAWCCRDGSHKETGISRPKEIIGKNHFTISVDPHEFFYMAYGKNWLTSLRLEASESTDYQTAPFSLMQDATTVIVARTHKKALSSNVHMRDKSERLIIHFDGMTLYSEQYSTPPRHDNQGYEMKKDTNLRDFAKDVILTGMKELTGEKLEWSDDIRHDAYELLPPNFFHPHAPHCITSVAPHKCLVTNTIRGLSGKFTPWGVDGSIIGHPVRCLNCGITLKGHSLLCDDCAIPFDEEYYECGQEETVA